MNDIARLVHLMPADPQLPVSAYFDEALFAREQALIFNKAARYIGHEKAVPQVGDWRRLAQEDGGRVLVHNPQGVELLSNVCRHRQALILGGETGYTYIGSMHTDREQVIAKVRVSKYMPEAPSIFGMDHFDMELTGRSDESRISSTFSRIALSSRGPSAIPSSCVITPRLCAARRRIASTAEPPVTICAVRRWRSIASKGRIGISESTYTR